MLSLRPRSDNYDERGPGPIDQDDFDVLQAFAKISAPLGTGALSFQGGRQENLSGADQQLWGLYLTRRLDGSLPFLSKAAVDLYYIGFFDAAATYNSGTGRELRHTLGTRFFGSQPIGPGMLDWNYESMLQFGSFDSQRGNGSILAWSVGTETGYTIDTFATPRLSLRANIISGNRSADSANLQTFNPLFPKGKYFGELTPVGPYNLINLLGAVGFDID